MKIILLSGGSGKRLWPLSNNTRSKQFLKMLQSAEGVRQSMVQRVWAQLEIVGLSESTVIATSKTQAEMIYTQLGLDVPLIVEPERRDTFPAIAIASSFLFSKQGVNLDETVIVLPVDSYVQDDFFERVKILDQIIQSTEVDLALIGVKPTYPASKYGYIVATTEESHDDYFNVKKFAEKPTEAQARVLIEQNALWNCGIFAFKLHYLMDIIASKGLSPKYDHLVSEYHRLPKISFDYEVVERADKVGVVPYEGQWRDLGTWSTLTEEMVTKQIGKGVISDDSKNTHLVNELEIPVTIVGLSNVIVAASPDGILVADKASSPQVKDLIDEFNQQPMYEERLWGWSKVLDYAKYPDEEMITKRICIHAGKNSTYHYHKFRSEVWTIVCGNGEIVLDGAVKRIKAGDTIHLPVGCKHAIRAISQLEFVEVQIGKEIMKTDFVRLHKHWITCI